MAAKRSYYEVLNVPEDADLATIKRAFRRLAFEYHPDRNKTPDAEDRFKEIAEAYAVLSDPEKRAAYDVGGHAGVAGYSAEDLFGGLDLEGIFGGFGHLGSSDLFGRFFGMRPRGPARGRHLEAEIVLPLRSVLTDNKETVRIQRPRVCVTCGGSGAKPGTSPRPCRACDGTGRLVRRERKAGVTFQQIGTCPDCGGKGSIIETPCSDCGGRGQSLVEEAIRVSIPAGIEHGTALRVRGHGLPSEDPGGPPGDLYVVVAVEPDARFERDGQTLWTEVTIEIHDAVLGARIEAPTLDGGTTLEIPAGTQPGSALRVPGEGLPAFGGGPRGDLRVRLRVHVPERLTSEERGLYERLRGTARAADGKPRRRRRGSLGSAIAKAWNSLNDRQSG